MRRSQRTIVGIAALALVASACVTGVKAGAKCRTADWGDDGIFAMKCEKGRWVQKVSKAQVAQLVIAVLKSKNPPASPTGACPSYQLVATLANNMFGPAGTLALSVSADGRKVAYVKDARTAPKIVVYDVPSRTDGSPLASSVSAAIPMLFLSRNGSTVLVDGGASLPSALIDVATGEQVEFDASARGISADGSRVLLQSRGGKLVLVGDGITDGINPFVSSYPSALLAGDGKTVLGTDGNQLSIWQPSGERSAPSPFRPTWINNSGTLAFGYQGGFAVSADVTTGVVTKLGLLGFGLTDPSPARNERIFASADGNLVLRVIADGLDLSMYLTNRSTGVTVKALSGMGIPSLQGGVISASDDLKVVATNNAVYSCS